MPRTVFWLQCTHSTHTWQMLHIKLPHSHYLHLQICPTSSLRFVTWHSRCQCKVQPCGETSIHISIWCKLLPSQMLLKGPRCKTGMVGRAVHNLSTQHCNEPQVSGCMGPVASLRSTWLASDSQCMLSHSHGGTNAHMSIACVCVCVCVWRCVWCVPSASMCHVYSSWYHSIHFLILLCIAQSSVNTQGKRTRQQLVASCAMTHNQSARIIHFLTQLDMTLGSSGCTILVTFYLFCSKVDKIHNSTFSEPCIVIHICEKDQQNKMHTFISITLSPTCLEQITVHHQEVCTSSLQYFTVHLYEESSHWHDPMHVRIFTLTPLLFTTVPTKIKAFIQSCD
jgi:hypothetical protein